MASCKKKKSSPVGPWQGSVICGFVGSLSLLHFGVAVRADAILYENGPPDNRNGSEMTQWIEADDIVVTQPIRLERIRFWDLEIDGFFEGSILWQIYADSPTHRPAELLYNGTSANLIHSATGVTTSGFREYVTDFSTAPVSLKPGTYWVALHNGPLTNTSTQNFFWEATSTQTGSASRARRAPFQGTWTSNASPTLPSDLAFQLYGVALPGIDIIAIDPFARLSFATVLGYNYRVESSEWLNGARWTVLPEADAVPGTGAKVQIVDLNTATGSKQRFYRAALAYNSSALPLVTDFQVTGEERRIRFLTVSGYYYRVEFNDSLISGNWLPVAGAETIAGTDSVVTVVDHNLPGSMRFYRVSLL